MPSLQSCITMSPRLRFFPERESPLLTHGSMFFLLQCVRPQETRRHRLNVPTTFANRRCRQTTRRCRQTTRRCMQPPQHCPPSLDPQHWSESRISYPPDCQVSCCSTCPLRPSVAFLTRRSVARACTQKQRAVVRPVVLSLALVN